MNVKTALILIAAVSAGFLFWVLKENKLPQTNNGNVAVASVEAWVEVIRPTAFQVNEKGENIKNLSSGDTMAPGITIATGPSGQAIIHFPDGSVLRADAKTTLTLDESFFEPKTEKLSVKVTLAAGKVWSKVVSLVSPDSVWRVKTSNAVATVRGTSFGVEYAKGKSRFVGSENKVKVAVIDPKTKEPKTETETEISPQKITEVKDAEVEKIAAAGKPLAISDAAPSVLAETWVKENKAADEVIDKTLYELRLEKHSDKESREELRKLNDKLRQELKPDDKSESKTKDEEAAKQSSLKEATENLLKTKIESEKTDKTAPETKTKTTDTTTSGTIKPSSSTVSLAKPVKIYISESSAGAAKEAVEGTKINLKAMLVLSDGTERDVTKEVKWNIKGRIGFIESPGVFVARFDDADSEFPEVVGEITVTFSADGVVLVSPPLPVKIIHSIEETVPVG